MKVFAQLLILILTLQSIKSGGFDSMEPEPEIPNDESVKPKNFSHHEVIPEAMMQDLLDSLVYVHLLQNPGSLTALCNSGILEQCCVTPSRKSSSNVIK